MLAEGYVPRDFWETAPSAALARRDAERVLRRAIEIETHGGEWIDGESLREIADAADVDPRSVALALEELEKERRVTEPAGRLATAPPAPPMPVSLSLTVSSTPNAQVSATVTVPAAAAAPAEDVDVTRRRLDVCLGLALLSAVLGLVLAGAAWAFGAAGFEVGVLWVLASWLGWGGLMAFIVLIAIHDSVVGGPRRSNRG